MASLDTIFQLSEIESGVLMELLPSIRTSVKNGLDMIELVKKAQEIESENVTIELSPENLNELVSEAISIVESEASKKNIQIKSSINPQQTVLVERTSFINSVLNNLLTNAIKFSYPDSEIAVTAQTRKSSTIVHIKDNGVGMPEELASDVFDAAKATSRPGTENETGTGFGMPLVEKYVTRYGGKITIISNDIETSPKDHGTDVMITLKSPPEATSGE